MKTLVVFYSLSGTTRTVAEDLARVLGGELAEIRCEHYRPGFWGPLRAVLDSVRGHMPEAAMPPQSVEDYDLVVAGGPVWASHAATPVKAFLEFAAPRLPRTALFLTHQGSATDSAFREMERLAGQSAVAKLAARKADLEGTEYASELAEFASLAQPETVQD